MQVPGGTAGKHLNDLFPPEYAAKYLDGIEVVKATNQLVDAIVPVIREDGTQAEVYAANFPLQGPDGVLYIGGCAIDITESRKAIKAVEFERADKEALINSTEDWMWSFDKNVRYITGNNAFKQVVNHLMSIDIQPGEPLLNEDRAKPAEYIFWKTRYERCLAGETFSEEIHEPNTNTWMFLTFNPMYQNGDVIGGTCLTKNISEIKNVQAAKEELIDKLQHTNDDLRQFSYTVSHDLRAPVRNLEALLQLYNIKDLGDPENMILIEAFKKTTIQLNGTLNNLINTLLVKEVQQKPDVSSLHFETVANRVLALISQTFTNAGASIHYDFSLAPHVVFNATYLESIFLNLLTNSIKYSKKEVPATIDIHSALTNEGAVQLIFKDNGQGFDMDVVKDRLFGLNQRFHKNKDSKGVGLYIVQTQLASLGGTITADSHVNEGATFTITFAK
jgi:signal transduction histidine kinase